MLGGVTTVSSSSMANGATVTSGIYLSLAPADSTNPGIMTNATQTFSGAKAFTLDVSLNTTYGPITLGLGGTGATNTVLRSQTATLGGTNNTAVGYRALNANTGSYGYNTALGSQALTTNNTGTYNTAIGYNALYKSQYDISNVAIGAFALQDCSGGIQNTAGGTQALQSNTTGDYNAAFGYQAGYAGTYPNTTGSYNTYLGYQAQASGSGYSNSTAIGAGATITASNQIVLGTTSEIVISSGALQTGYDVSLNTTYGPLTVGLGGTGATNTVLRYQTSKLGGTNNTAVGYRALNGNTGSYSYSTAIGSQALAINPSGYSNTAVGYQSLASDTYGYYNTAIGYQSLYVNNGGFNNTALGLQSLNGNTTGSYNTGVGYYSGATNTSGTYNTYVGYNANANAGTYSKSTALGTGATITASNQIMLGTSTETVVANGLLDFTQSSYVASANATTTSYYTFTDAGVYLLFVASGGNSSNSVATTDNLARVYLAVVSSTAGSVYPVYLINLFISKTGTNNYFGLSSTTSKVINLDVYGGSYTYNLWVRKLF